MIAKLTTGAEMRVTGSGALAVVCVNGGQGHEVAGTWSATLEWLVGRLAPRFAGLRFGEVRYRIKSWRKLDWCIEDARAAVRALGAPRTLFVVKRTRHVAGFDQLLRAPQILFRKV